MIILDFELFVLGNQKLKNNDIVGSTFNWIRPVYLTHAPLIKTIFYFSEAGMIA